MNIVICIDLDLFLYIWTAWPSQLRCCIICKYHSAWLGAPSHSPAPRLCSLVDCSFFQHQKLNTRIQSYLLRQFHRQQSSILRPQWIASPSAPNLNGRLLNLNGRSNRRQSWVIHCDKPFNQPTMNSPFCLCSCSSRHRCPCVKSCADCLCFEIIIRHKLL